MLYVVVFVLLFFCSAFAAFYPGAAADCSTRAALLNIPVGSNAATAWTR